MQKIIDSVSVRVDNDFYVKEATDDFINDLERKVKKTNIQVETFDLKLDNTKKELDSLIK